jgi:hypothetical protein
MYHWQNNQKMTPTPTPTPPMNQIDLIRHL